MNQDFTFEALKGNAKLLDIEEVISNYKQQLREWVDPYYDQEHQDWSVLGYEDTYFLYIEPNWPPGQKRTLSKKYAMQIKQIRELCNIQSKLFDIAFPDWRDDNFAKYSVQPVVINRNEYNKEVVE